MTKFIPVPVIGCAAGIIARYGYDSNLLWMVALGLLIACLSGVLIQFKYPLEDIFPSLQKWK